MRTAQIMYASSILRPAMMGEVTGEAIRIREAGSYTLVEAGPADGDGGLAVVAQTFQVLTDHVLSVEVRDADRSEGETANGDDRPDE